MEKHSFHRLVALRERKESLIWVGSTVKYFPYQIAKKAGLGF